MEGCHGLRVIEVKQDLHEDITEYATEILVDKADTKHDQLLAKPWLMVCQSRVHDPATLPLIWRLFMEFYYLETLNFSEVQKWTSPPDLLRLFKRAQITRITSGVKALIKPDVWMTNIG